MHSSDKDSFQYLSCDSEGVVPTEEEMKSEAHRPLITDAMLKMGHSFLPSGNRPKFVFKDDCEDL
jgi:hypothetical protein